MERRSQQPAKALSRRNGFKWTTSEVLKLQREYHLLRLSIETIAKNHERSHSSILYKLKEIEKDILLEETLEKYSQTIF